MTAGDRPDATWDDLFDRAADEEVTVEAVRAALARRRDDG